MWKTQHATGQREINELHVPVGRKIKLIMTSEDVIHDFFVPAFRIKADVVPGKYTTQWFEATKPGTYHLFCAEYCGMNHSGMIGSVIVMEPSEFDNWLSGNTSSRRRPPRANSCFKRWAVLPVTAPMAKADVVRRWRASLARQRCLQSGQTLTADEAYIRESIMNPQAKLVAGFGPIMPTFQGQVSEDQLMQIDGIYQVVAGRRPADASRDSRASATPAATSEQ